MTGYMTRKKVRVLPRLPLRGTLDLTYRCNNDCRHCWLRLPPDAPDRDRELTPDEIRGLAAETRSLGCRRWNLFGGEPLLRPDFPEIFETLVRENDTYTLNTNGTLITPAIARLLRKPGSKLVALYGADAAVHDDVTRRPGSFEALMQGLAYLREAGADFTIQIVPMRANYHQFAAMTALAEKLSPNWRLGAVWLYLSASGDPERNREIEAQRLTPAESAALLGPVWAWSRDGAEEAACGMETSGAGPYAACIANRRDFHVDPYGGLSFCSMVKDPELRCDLRRGTFREGWETFIPSLSAQPAAAATPSPCAACALRADCRRCAVHGWLEHRDHNARVEFLCDMARETKALRESWERNNRRHYRMAGVTIQVDSDLPFAPDTFDPKFEPFRVDGPGEDTVRIHHHFALPDLDGIDLGPPVYRRPPWSIHRRGESWIYLGIAPRPDDPSLHRVAVFNADYSRGRIYNATEKLFRRGGLDALTIFSSDQILLAHVLAAREGFYLHAAGVVMDGRGLLFSGPSEAGKSTMVKMLRGRVEILCDDRMVVRRHRDGFRIHGTWSHGELPDVSPSRAPLAGLFFLRQSKDNRIVRVDDKAARFRMILERVVRPLTTADWWDRTMALAERLAAEAPVYELHFDRSGRIVQTLEEFVR